MGKSRASYAAEVGGVSLVWNPAEMLADLVFLSALGPASSRVTTFRGLAFLPCLRALNDSGERGGARRRRLAAHRRRFGLRTIESDGPSSTTSPAAGCRALQARRYAPISICAQPRACSGGWPTAAALSRQS